MSSVGARFAFSGPDGYRLVRDTVRDILPYVPHDYQLEGVCKLLDGVDLVAVIPTGGGKTGYYLVFMLMLLALSKSPALAPGTKIPADPCIVMVYPTNGLEEEQACVFERAGITALVLNANTLSAARRSGQDLWKAARTGVSVLLLSPEQLVSPGFESLLQHGPFQRRLCALGVDEIHLLYSWGQLFRQAFRQIGYTRARMSLQTRMIGTTATLLAGHPEETILRFLGLRRGEFHLVRRSNLRRNVRTIFRTVTHGLGGWSFADLRWILTSGRKTVIHCRTIAQGFRLAIYLWQIAPPLPDRHVRIRTYNALNWPSYNTKTRELMRDDPRAQIIIATASFMVGIDLPNIADVVIVGHLVNADEHVQWEGRAGRDPRVVADARCITYVTSKALETARALCAGEPPRVQKTSGGKKTVTVQMELSMARLLCAECVSAEQDTLYDNPSTDTPCLCPSCNILDSSMSPSASPTVACTCSGPQCHPEDVPPANPPAPRKDNNPIPRKLRISPKMRAVGDKQLKALRMQIYRDPSTANTQTFPPEMYLPDTVIKHVLDNTLVFESEDALREAISTREFLLPHTALLWGKIQELAQLFRVMKAEKAALDKEKRKQQNAARAAAREPTIIPPPRDPRQSESAGMTAVRDRLITARSNGTAVSSSNAVETAPLVHDESRAMFRVDLQASPGVCDQVSSTGDVTSPGGALLQWDLNESGNTDTQVSTSMTSSGQGNTAVTRSSRKRSGSATQPEYRPRTRARTMGKENLLRKG